MRVLNDFEFLRPRGPDRDIPVRLLRRTSRSAGRCESWTATAARS